MSKLVKAPLVEVIFEIRWDSQNPQDINEFQILLGSMYSKLNQKYINKINLLPDPNLPYGFFIGNPTHRFQSKDGYPLFQLGPGVLSVNTVDSNYYWNSFLLDIKEVVDVFCELFHPLQQQATLILKYIDFFNLDYTKECVFDFLSKKLNINIESKLFEGKKPHKFNFSTSCALENGSFSLNINTGFNKINNAQVHGLIVESNFSKEISFSTINAEIDSYLKYSHEYLSTFFKQMTNGSLYDSFK